MESMGLRDWKGIIQKQVSGNISSIKKSPNAPAMPH